MSAAPQTAAVHRLDVHDLIDHIMEAFHAVHRAELPELERLARKVEAVHADHPECPTGLADLIAEMGAELEAHMQKEEQVLFPMMRAGGHPMIVHPIAMMRSEHVMHGDNLERLKTTAQNFVLPKDGCGTWVQLYVGLEKLYADLSAHIETENSDLFTRFAAR